MVVLALALGYFAFDKFILSQSRETTIAEELLNLLAKIPKVAEYLNVAHILEGSVRKPCDGSVIFLCTGGPILVELDAGSGEISCPT